MHIAYLVSQYPAVNHTFILREVRYLRQNGFLICVISIRAPDRSTGQLNGLEREELGYTRAVLAVAPWKAALLVAATLFSRPAGFLRGLFLALRLTAGRPAKILLYLGYFAEAVIAGRWMTAEKHTHFHTHFASTVGLLVQATFPITMSATFHGPDEFTDPSGFHLARKIHASVFVCAISDFARSQLMRFSQVSEWSKIHVVRLGVDPSLFPPRPAREYPDPFEIICVGRLAPVKAQHILLGAVARLVEAGYRIRLRLVGDGPERKALEARVGRLGLESIVVFDGWLDEDAVRERYRQADIFASASFAEGVPVVLMEAMSMEIPCVATWVAGIPELISDQVHGLLAPPSDEESLAQAIARLIDDPELRRRVAKAGRIRVEERYNLAANGSRLAALFQSCAAAPNRR